jgi:hypothetical protein
MLWSIFWSVLPTFRPNIHKMFWFIFLDSNLKKVGSKY